MPFPSHHEISPLLLERLVANVFDKASKGNKATPLMGLEIEIEGDGCHNKANSLNSGYWRLDHDQSLRGESIEAVFSTPLTGQQSQAALEDFKRNFGDFNQNLLSERCSVHVHYNVSNHTVKELHRLLTSLYLFENALVLRSGGPAREGNKFCLRNTESDTPLTALIRMFQTQDFYRGVQTKTIGRYSNINLRALSKFGSIEIRCHKGSTDAAEILTYMKVFKEICYNSVHRFESASELIQGLSAMGYDLFMQTNFPDTYEYFGQLPDPEGKIDECLDFAQSLAFCFTEDRDGLKKPKRFQLRPGVM